MNKLNLLAALTGLILLFSACSKDDDFSITGTWNHEKTEARFYMGSILLETMEEPGEGTITFNDDGTGTATSDFGPSTFQWSLSGNNLTLTETGQSLTFELTTKRENRIVAESGFTMQEFSELFEEFEFEDMEGLENITIIMALSLNR